MSVHFRELCKLGCGNVVRSCRCPGPHTATVSTTLICKACQEKQTDGHKPV